MKKQEKFQSSRRSSFLISALLIAATLTGCGGDKPRHIFDGNSTEFSASPDGSISTQPQESRRAGREVRVPYRVENGVKYVNVKVNGMGIDMVFDTGCSSALISVAEANYLYEKGRLASEDIIGVSLSQIADGSIVANLEVILREVVIADQITYHNVRATVADNISAPLLLGNSVLDSLASIKIDNENEALVFTLKE